MWRLWSAQWIVIQTKANTAQSFSRTFHFADSAKKYDSRQTNITWSINSPIFIIDPPPPFLSWYEKGADPEYSKTVLDWESMCTESAFRIPTRIRIRMCENQACSQLLRRLQVSKPCPFAHLPPHWIEKCSIFTHAEKRRRYYYTKRFRKLDLNGIIVYINRWASMRIISI